MPHLRVMVVPAQGPRTKPKALDWAIPFSRGTFLAVYDAEDRPDPGQLRAALDAFRMHEPNVACVQASLVIHNARDSWLSRMFATEYAGQFDGFMPGIAWFGLPLPLGGSSNHFRTSALREVGGWDPYNVTEDADLGVRLARFGYRSVMFSSDTYEEAPARFGSWLRQRTRWMKGWMQTWSVHMRAPWRLCREAGISGFLTLNLMIGGNVLAALAHPFLLVAVIADMLSQHGGWSAFTQSFAPLMSLHLITIAAGYLSSIMAGLVGLSRRKRLRDGWILLLTPLYWICLSLAAWRALYQLLRDPYRWEKTEHGVSAHEWVPPQEHSQSDAERELPAHGSRWRTARVTDSL